MKTKIICTIGPSSVRKDILRKMIKGGMNIARINFSHGDYKQYQRIISSIRDMSKELNKNINILCDLQGAKIRLANFRNYPKKLEDGKQIVIASTNCLKGEKGVVYVESADFHEKVHTHETILIDDGKIELKIKKISGCKIYCKIIRGGDLYPNKGINIPHNTKAYESITQKDKKDINFINKTDCDLVSLSFVKNAEDIIQLRKLVKNHKIKLISKVENAIAIKNLTKIIKISDGIMVARGDLGIEIPIEQLPIIQKQIIKKCNNFNTFVITATHMLDSMTRVPYPTRAEVTDVANAIIDGTDAVLLSNETAVGKYPVKSVEILVKIVKETEKYIYKRVLVG